MDQKTLDEIKKKFGIVTGTSYKRIRESCLCLSTGVFAVDMMTGEIDDEGVAGIRERDVLEAFGPNNSLKTALSIAMMAKTLKRFGPHSVMGIFSEPFDPDRMMQAGVNVEDMLMFPIFEVDEETGEVTINEAMAESALESALHMCKRDDIRLIVIDSVAAMMPKMEMYDGKDLRALNSSPVAAKAKIINAFIAKYKNLNRKSVLCLINHYREPVQIDLSQVFMDKSKIITPGGRGMEFASDVRVLCNSTIELEKEPHSITGTKQGKQYNTSWIMIKNKYCNTVAHRSAKGVFNTEFGEFNNVETLIDWASFFAEKNKEVIYSKLSPAVYKGGSWITVGDQKVQGMEKAVKFLKTNSETIDSLMKQMYPLHGQFFEDRKPSLEELMETNG